MRFWPFADALARAAPDLAVNPLAEPPQDVVELANAAHQLLRDPVFQLAMERLQAGLVDRWQRSAVGNRDERENAYLLHAAIAELRAELTRMVAAGGQNLRAAR